MNKIFFSLVILNHLAFSGNEALIDKISSCLGQISTLPQKNINFWSSVEHAKEIIKSLFDPEIYDIHGCVILPPHLSKWIHCAPKNGNALTPYVYNIYYQLRYSDEKTIEDVIRASKDIDDKNHKNSYTFMQNYKLNFNISGDYMQWALEQIKDDIIKNSDLYKSIEFKISWKDPSAEKASTEEYLDVHRGPRTLPSIVMYGNHGDLQEVLNHMEDIFGKYPEIASPLRLRHECGGPIVYWAGGDADYKPGGVHYIKDYKNIDNIFVNIGTDEDPNFAYIKGQQPLINRYGLCATKDDLLKV